MAFLNIRYVLILVLVIIVIAYVMHVQDSKSPMKQGLINNPNIEMFTTVKTVSSSANASTTESEESSFTCHNTVPLAIDTNGYPLLCKNANPCNKDVTNPNSGNISENCISMINDSCVTIVNLANNEIGYSVFVNLGVPQGKDILDEVDDWYKDNTENGHLNVKARESKTIYFPLSGLYTFRRRGSTSMDTGGQSGKFSKNFQVYIN